LPTETYTTITNMIYETTFYKSVISDYVGVHTIDNAETDAKKK
jgi:hypothetical protein